MTQQAAAPPAWEARVRVPVDPNEFSPNKRFARHPNSNAVLRREKSRAMAMAAETAWLDAGSPVAPGPVIVTMIIRRGVRLDDDNARAGLKSVRDRLFCAKRYEEQGGAITPNDGHTHVTEWRIQWDTGKRWKGAEEVEYVVTLAPPDPPKPARVAAAPRPRGRRCREGNVLRRGRGECLVVGCPACQPMAPD